MIRDHLIAESGDLLFHLLVLLKSRGVKLEDVEAALAQRTSMSDLKRRPRASATNKESSFMDIRAPEQQYNPYRIFPREQWARLRDDTPMTLEPGEFDAAAFVA